MRAKRFFINLCIGVIFILIFYYLENHGYIQTVQTSTRISYPSIASPSAVLGENTNSQCHAIHVNIDDPEAFLPDPSCTPGVIDPAVTQENISETICKSGYTKTVRPPVSYTNKLKKEQIQLYGFLDTDMRHYEEDHHISLELGGSPTDPKNLWPEPGASTNEKDIVENYLHRQVCSGSMTLHDAQEVITKNWYEVYVQIKK